MTDVFGLNSHGGMVFRNTAYQLIRSAYHMLCNTAVYILYAEVNGHILKNCN